MVLFQQHLFKTKKAIVSTIMTCCFIALTISLHAQNYLEVPVKLDIDKGNMDGVVVKVKKNGKDAFTQSGSGKMKFKLDFNKTYTLIFTKKDYITKTIEFNTTAPSNRIKDGFEPYQIGVKLFSQEDDNHTVVYNQAVGRIHFDKQLDEFNYETDYNKSILSDMPQTAEAEAETTETAVIPDEELLAQNDSEQKAKKKDDKRGKKKNDDANGDDSPTGKNKKKGSEKLEPQENNDTKPAINSTAANDPPPVLNPKSANEAPPALNSNSANDTPSALRSNSGNDNSNLIAMSSGNDNDAGLLPSSGTEKPSAIIKSNSSVEMMNTPISSGNGAESNSPQQYDESENITREDIVENNRVITIVRVTKRNTTVEYRRVIYRWGGPFYFKDSKQSISENVFAFNTGVKD